MSTVTCHLGAGQALSGGPTPYSIGTHVGRRACPQSHLDSCVVSPADATRPGWPGDAVDLVLAHAHSTVRKFP